MNPRVFSVLIVAFLLPILPGCGIDETLLFSNFGKNGYSFFSLGEHSRFIVYNGGGQVDSIVVDARVSKYLVRGDVLFVLASLQLAYLSKKEG